MTDVNNSEEPEIQTQEPVEEALPPLSPTDFKRYNRLAKQMDLFHNHFRQSWKTMQTACTTSNKPPGGMSQRQFLQHSLDFCYTLNAHHGIEEKHVFPSLARKMPAFKHNDLMRTQHHEIHSGLEKLQNWLEECVKGKRDFEKGEMKDIMDSFEEMLWKHLDEEVEQLGAENMRKYWTIQEMDRIVF